MFTEPSVVGKPLKQVLNTLLDKTIVGMNIEGSNNNIALFLKLDEGTEVIMISEVKTTETK